MRRRVAADGQHSLRMKEASQGLELPGEWKIVGTYAVENKSGRITDSKIKLTEP